MVGNQFWRSHLAGYDRGQVVLHSVRLVLPRILGKMRKDQEWIDTAFVHALGRAHGVNVLIFQPGIDEALVGEDLMESAEEERIPPIMVPIALVNDHHFWGVIESGPELAIEPVDKGELAAFRSQREVKTSEADISFEDGESPEVAFRTTTTALDVPEAMEAELELCHALATWGPWSGPSEQMLQAMDKVQRWRDGPGLAHADLATTCLRRAEALTEMAYEEACHGDLPEICRYQRLARIRLRGCAQWTRRAKCSNQGIQNVTTLKARLEAGSCERHNRTHGPGNPHCGGLAMFSATMVYNWRVLWWSLP